MDDFMKKDMEEAQESIAKMIERSEKAQEKFAQGTSQFTLQKNRIKALHIASALIISELTGENMTDHFSEEDLERAAAPIESLFSKSEKAQKKLAQGTWQYKMLDDNIKALKIVSPLLTKALNRKKEEIILTAGYCGLACKACSVYIASSMGGETLRLRAEKAGLTSEEMYCKGCRSDKTSPYCAECQIKKCIRKKELEWCSECKEYPCKMLIDFQNSLPHRVEILDSLDFAKEHSFAEWDQAMHKDFSCGHCGTYNSVYANGCTACGNTAANPFAERHWDIIKDSPERNLI